MNFETMGKLISKKRIKIEKSYYRIVDDLEQVLGNHNVSPPNLNIKEFSLFSKWYRGEVSTSQVVKKLNKLDAEKIAENKIVKKLHNFSEGMGRQVPLVENKVRLSVYDLRRDVLPEYVSYINWSKQYFELLEDVDKSQIKIVKGLSKDGKNYSWEEMPLNQAIKYAKNNLSLAQLKYVLNDYMIAFETFDKDKKDPKSIDWFLCPGEYVKVFCRALGITSKCYFGSDDKIFYKHIGNFINGEDNA